MSLWPFRCRQSVVEKPLVGRRKPFDWLSPNFAEALEQVCQRFPEARAVIQGRPLRDGCLYLNDLIGAGINCGQAPNDLTGDTLDVAAEKIAKALRRATVSAFEERVEQVLAARSADGADLQEARTIVIGEMLAEIQTTLRTFVEQEKRRNAR